MIKEKNPLLKLKLTKTNSCFKEFYSKFSELLYELFDFILDDPIENFWYECINISFGYMQLITFLVDSKVSN